MSEFIDRLHIIQCLMLKNAKHNNARLALEYAVEPHNPQPYSTDSYNCNSYSDGQSQSKCIDASVTYTSLSDMVLPRKEKQRLYFIDNLRVLACFLVLLTHSAMAATDYNKEGFWLFALSFIGSPSSELFLALSGTVLLPVKTSFRIFYKRRFTKLVPPLVIWSVLGILLYTQTQSLSWSNAISSILNIPFQPTIGVYWFVYVMAGLYLIAPIISPWLQNATKHQLELFLLLWCVNMIIPWLQCFIPNSFQAFHANGNYYWTLCYFGGFLGYWLLGYYLRKYPVTIGWNVKWTGIVIGNVLYPIIIATIKNKGISVDSLTDNLQIGSAFQIALLYTIMQNIKVKTSIQKILTQIAKYSFGIYLTHIYIARELYWGLFEGSSIHIFPRTFFIASLTLLTGYLLTYLLAKLPKGKYITGV